MPDVSDGTWVADFVVRLNDVFTPTECDRVATHIQRLGQSQGGIGRKDGRGAEFDLDVRRVRQTTLSRARETAWIFERLGERVGACNAIHFGFDLGEFEPLLLAEYREGDFYDWHLDIGRAAPARKLSVSVMLSPRDEYEGGALSFPGVVVGDLQPGCAVVFASFLLHGVQPVTRGRRRALVGWIGGPPFR